MRRMALAPAARASSTWSGWTMKSLRRQGRGGGAPAPGFGFVNDVVVHQRGGVDHFDDGGHADQAGVRLGAEEFAAEQDQDGAQALAAARLQILADVGDGVDRSHRFQADFALHLIQVVANQVEDFERGERRTDVAERHGLATSLSDA